MKNYNGESYMESYSDKEHEAAWGDAEELDAECFEMDDCEEE